MASIISLETCLPLTALAANRRSSILELVHEPINIRSYKILLILNSLVDLPLHQIHVESDRQN